MSDEYRKIRRHNRIVLIILAILTILFGISMWQSITKPSPAPVINNYQGQDGRDGKDTAVDYEKINDYIDSQVSKIPRAKDGANGKDGQNGLDGRDGRNGTDASPCTVKEVDNGSQITCPDGSNTLLLNGTEGAQGRPGRVVFVRQNPETQEQECRYAGDDTWQPIEECS